MGTSSHAGQGYPGAGANTSAPCLAACGLAFASSPGPYLAALRAPLAGLPTFSRIMSMNHRTVGR